MALDYAYGSSSSSSSGGTASVDYDELARAFILDENGDIISDSENGAVIFDSDVTGDD